VSVGFRQTRLSPADKGGFVLDGIPTGTQPVQITSPGYASYNGSVIVHKDQPSDIGTIGLAPVGP
jgi:hypothetical protein